MIGVKIESLCVIKSRRIIQEQMMLRSIGGCHHFARLISSYEQSNDEYYCDDNTRQQFV